MFPGCLPHPLQPLGHACLALCRGRARLKGVLLDQRPSLLTLPPRFPISVRMFLGIYAAVRLLGDVRAGRTALAFSRPPAVIVPSRHPRGLPVLVSEASRRARGLRLRRAGRESRAVVSRPYCLPLFGGRRRPDCGFSELNVPAHLCLCLRFAGHLAIPQRKTRGRVDRYSFLVRLFHPLLQTGLSRRTQTSLWRARAGVEVSRPLQPPCRYLQRPTGKSRRRSCQLSLARLQGWQTPEGDDSRGGGIHPPLPSPYLAFRLRQNSPLRFPGEPQPL